MRGKLTRQIEGSHSKRKEINRKIEFGIEKAHSTPTWICCEPPGFTDAVNSTFIHKLERCFTMIMHLCLFNGINCNNIVLLDTCYNADKLYSEHLLKKKKKSTASVWRTGDALPCIALKWSLICELLFSYNATYSHPNTVSLYTETVNQRRRELACKTVIEINLFVASAVWERSLSDVPSVTETKTLNWKVKTEN